MSKFKIFSKPSESTLCLFLCHSQNKIRIQKKMGKNLKSLPKWLGNALEFTLGNPSKERHAPPAIGIQPYRDKPLKSH